MKSEFTLSQPTKKFGRWGTNLGRVGTELALKLIKKDGICGIVSPASLFNDQVSIPLREWIFNNHKILYLSYYPAELKLYGTADVSSVTAVFGCGETTDSFVIRLFDAEKKCTLKQLTPSSFDYIKRNLYSLPLESGFESIEILQYLETLPSVLSFYNSNDFRFTRELDETRIAEKLLTSGNIVFAKGYMVDRYCFLGDGLFVDEEKVDVPDSSQKWKIVWRDVSRNSQCRRMKATLLPPGHIAGNSLGIIYAEDEANIDELKLLLAVMNSMVFEFQARCLLVSNHVAAGIIKQIRIPRSMFDSTIVGLVDRQLMGNDCSQELEIRVAKLYGLSIEQFMSIVVAFDLDSQIVQQIAEKVCLIYGEDY